LGRSERWWPRKGSRPSPQSPKGILGFLSSDAITSRTRRTKANLLKLGLFAQAMQSKKSPRLVKNPASKNAELPQYRKAYIDAIRRFCYGLTLCSPEHTCETSRRKDREPLAEQH